MEYTAEDYIDFIVSGRMDKISPLELYIIATRFKELQDEIESLRYEILEIGELNDL